MVISELKAQVLAQKFNERLQKWLHEYMCVHMRDDRDRFQVGSWVLKNPVLPSGHLSYPYVNEHNKEVKYFHNMTNICRIS